MATDFTGALARLLSDASLRGEFARDPARVAGALNVAERHRLALCSLPVEQLEAQANVLRAKRFHEVAALLPRTVARLGDAAMDIFRAHSESFWPTTHRRHLEDAVTFAEFLAGLHPAYVDVAELNRLRFLNGNGRVAVHFARVRVPGPRPRRAMQLLYRVPSGGVRSWFIHLGA